MNPYFCIDENSAHLTLAEPVEPNEKLAHFGRLAAELGIVLPVGFFERSGTAFYNSVAIFDADGTLFDFEQAESERATEAPVVKAPTTKAAKPKPKKTTP